MSKEMIEGYIEGRLEGKRAIAELMERYQTGKISKGQLIEEYLGDMVDAIYGRGKFTLKRRQNEKRN